MALIFLIAYKNDLDAKIVLELCRRRESYELYASNLLFRESSAARGTR